MLFRIFTFGVAATIGMALGIWTIDREPPTVTIKTEVLTPEVSPGGVLKVHYFVKRFRDCEVKIDRILTDSQRVRVVLPDLEFSKAPGPMGDDDFVTEVPVPQTFSKGPAVYMTLTSYRCNIVHNLWPILVGPAQVLFVIDGSPVDLPVVTPRFFPPR